MYGAGKQPPSSTRSSALCRSFSADAPKSSKSPTRYVFLVDSCIFHMGCQLEEGTESRLFKLEEEEEELPVVEKQV